MCMDSQRAAGQGEAKAQQNPQPQAPPYGRLGAPVGRPVGYVMRFRIALAGRVVEVPWSVWSLFRGQSLFRWIL